MKKITIATALFGSLLPGCATTAPQAVPATTPATVATPARPAGVVTVPTVAAAPAAAPRVTPPRLKMTTDIPSSITTPDSVETRFGTLNFHDGVPDDPTIQKVYDNLDFQRGV